MPDRKRSSFEVPNPDQIGRCRYRLDEEMLRNRSASSRNPGSATGESLTISSNRRVKSGSSISNDGRKMGRDGRKHDYAITGSNLFVDPGVTVSRVPNQLIVANPKMVAQSDRNVVRKDREPQDLGSGDRTYDTKETKNKSLTKEGKTKTAATKEYLKQDMSDRSRSQKTKTKKKFSSAPVSSKNRSRSPIPMRKKEESPSIQKNNELATSQPLATKIPNPFQQRTVEPQLMSTPAPVTQARSDPARSDSVISPISLHCDSIIADRTTGSRSETSLSQYSVKSFPSVSINTQTPISAWSDYTVPNEDELRQKLMKGRFGAQFENYYPYVSRKKLLYVPPPDDDNEEDYDTDLEDGGFDLVAVERARQRKADSPFPDYKSLCRELGSVPNSYFLRQALEDDLDMRFRYPGVNDTKALATEIKNDATISRLDLTDNGLGPSQLINIAEMLHNNTTITHVNVSENCIGPAGARILTCVLRSESRLYSLNLGGNKLGDKGARYIISGLERNVFLKELNLSHNEIGEIGMKYLCPFLAGNVTLDVLDLSWNHIRKQGAVQLAKAVKMNQQLRVLRVSMNGFHVDGARALGTALEENTTLWELDISANRIPRSGARAVASGLECNTELRCLKVGFNPLTPEGAMSILDAVENRDNTEGIVVDFEGVYVNQDFESQVADLTEDKKVKIHFSLEPSRRGRSRDFLSGYIHDLKLLLKGLNIDVTSIYSDVTEDNVIISGNDIIQRLLKSNRLKDKTAQAELNHFIYCNGNRKFLLRDWMVCTSNG